MKLSEGSQLPSEVNAKPKFSIGLDLHSNDNRICIPLSSAKRKMIYHPKILFPKILLRYSADIPISYLAKPSSHIHFYGYCLQPLLL